MIRRVKRPACAGRFALLLERRTIGNVPLLAQLARAGELALMDAIEELTAAEAA